MKWLHIAHCQPAWEILTTDATHISWFVKPSFRRDVDIALIRLLEGGLAKRLPPKQWFIRVDYAYARAYRVLLRFMPHLYELPGKVVVASMHKIEGFETVQCGYVLPWSNLIRPPEPTLGRRVIVYAGFIPSLDVAVLRGLHILLPYSWRIKRMGFIPTLLTWELPEGLDVSGWEVYKAIPPSQMVKLVKECALMLYAAELGGWSRFNWTVLRAEVPILQLDRRGEFTRASYEWSAAASIALPITNSQTEFECMLWDALRYSDILYSWRDAWRQVQEAHPLLFDEQTILQWFIETFGDVPQDLLPLNELTPPDFQPDFYRL